MSSSDFWNRHVFVLLTPDALLRGIQRDFVRRLVAEGFPPVAASLSVTNSDMIDELYADVIAGHWETWRYRMIDDAFSLAPCLGLICRYDGAGDPHVVMRAKKGHQHPARTVPGELRRDFGAVNSIVGVMHASDNPIESAKDASIFSLTAADAEAGESLDERIELLCALTTPASPEQRDFDAVLGQLRADILVAFLPRLSDPKTISRLAGLLGGGDGATADLAQPAALAAPGAGAELVQLCADVLPADLLDVLGCDFTESTRAGRRGADLFATIRRHGIEVDPWQRVVLESSLYFEPERRRP
jgi:nucleoside diphosphate kinase